MDILIVEDEILLGLLLADALTDVGHRVLALGLVEKPYNPTTILEVVRYFEALHAGERPAGVPRGLELFGPDALPVSLGLLDTSAPAVVPCAVGATPWRRRRS